MLATIVGMVLSLFFHVLDLMNLTNDAPDAVEEVGAKVVADPVL